MVEVIKSIGYFDLKWKTDIHTDTSPTEIAAWLTQHNPANLTDRKLIRCASRKLSPLKRFDPYLIGSEFNAHVDCKAVELIFNNLFSKPAELILNWAMRAGHYKVNIKHRPGLGNFAFFISRHPQKELKSSVSKNAENFVNMIIKYTLPLCNNKRKFWKKLREINV
jgi:hypothetical protein